jgi:uncharacterized membrane protein
MPSEPANLDPQELWQSQTPEYDPMTIAAVHDKARSFQARVWRRNAIEYCGGAIAIVGFLPVVFRSGSWMIQAGAALIIAAIVFVVWQLHRRTSAKGVPEAGEPLVGFYRAELIRQRDALRSIGVWYLAPAVPGMALMLLGRWFQSHAAGRSLADDHFIIALVSVAIALFFLVVWLVNQRGAERLQRRIDEL